MDTKTITNEPVYVYSHTENDKTIQTSYNSSHKCGCEKCLFGDVDNKNGCPTGIVDSCDFRIYVGGGNDDGCGTCAIFCFPLNFTVKLLCIFPCATYNSCRNKCGGTNNLNYIC